MRPIILLLLLTSLVLLVEVGSVELRYKGDATCNNGPYGISLDSISLDCGLDLFDAYNEARSIEEQANEAKADAFTEAHGEYVYNPYSAYMAYVAAREEEFDDERRIYRQGICNYTDGSNILVSAQFTANYGFDSDIRITTKMCTSDLSQCKILSSRQRVTDACNETVTSFSLVNLDGGDCPDAGSYWISKILEIPEEGGLDEFMNLTFYKKFKLSFEIEHSQYTTAGSVHCNAPLLYVMSEEEYGQYHVYSPNWMLAKNYVFSALGGVAAVLGITAYGRKKRRLTVAKKADEHPQESGTEFVPL